MQWYTQLQSTGGRIAACGGKNADEQNAGGKNADGQNASGQNAALDCCIATTWLGSNEAPSLLSKFSHLNHMMETFLPKTNCACDMAQSHHVQFETALQLHKGKHLEAYRDAKQTT